MAGKAIKQYGLILPPKGAPSKTLAVPKKNVFGDDSDSGTDDGGDWVKKSLKLEAQKSVLKRTTKIQMQKAVEEDPTVFQYDEIYDDLEQKKVEATSAKKGVEKKPRYIQALLQTAERRKKENERRIERQVQKDREEEGTQFSDKESFVTSSYRQKLEEFKKQEEEEKRMERLEAIGDVTKQKDLTGFYRHLYRQTMGESLSISTDDIQPEKEGATNDSEITPEESVQIPSDLKESAISVKVENQKKDRHYRKRRSSSSSSEGSREENKSSGSIKQENIDADSDFTRSSSSSSGSASSVTGSGSEDGEITKKKKESKKVKKEKEIPKKKSKQCVEERDKDTDDSFPLSKDNPACQISIEEDKAPSSENCVKSEDKDTDDIKNGSAPGAAAETVELEKPKIDVWAKRTIDQVFDDAVRRYYERKAARAALRRA